MRVFHKVLLAVVLSSLLLIALVMVFFYQSVTRGFSHYANAIELAKAAPLIPRLEAAYDRYGRNWDFLRHNSEGWHQLLTPLREQRGPPGSGDRFGHRGRPPPPRPGPDWADGNRPPPPPDGYPPPPFGGPPGDRHGYRWPPPPPPPTPVGDPLDIGPRLTLYDLDQQPVMGHGNYADEIRLVPIKSDQQAVGWLAVSAAGVSEGGLDALFLEEVRRSLTMTGGVALLLSVLIAALLTRHILGPVRTLAAAVRRLTGGDYRVRPSSERRDELGQLGRDFNLLAETLRANEQSRQRWVADISHELRTPIASLRAEVEALQDGVIALDDDSLASLHGEVMRLGRLVDDLHQLARADAGELQYQRVPVDPAELLDQAAAAIAHLFHAAGLSLDIECSGCGRARVYADPNRLLQLFTNLLENSRRYTDRGGRVEVRCERAGRRLILHFDDSAPGIPPGEYERVFERLYRVDKSRARASGGSGLGLAICRQIVEAHQGRIAATPSTLGGVAVTVTLPVDD